MFNRRRIPLLQILFAALMAGAGNGISIVAFPWLVLQRTGSALDASLVAMAEVAEAVGDFTGALTRWSDAISVCSASAEGLSVAAVPVVALTAGVEAVNVGVLATLAAFGSLFDPAGMTARESMLPEAATRAGWTLDHANSVYEAVFNLAYIVGPGIGDRARQDAMLDLAPLFDATLLEPGVERCQIGCG